jgi:hypothetical protein
MLVYDRAAGTSVEQGKAGPSVARGARRVAGNGGHTSFSPEASRRPRVRRDIMAQAAAAVGITEEALGEEDRVAASRLSGYRQSVPTAAPGAISREPQLVVEQPFNGPGHRRGRHQHLATPLVGQVEAEFVPLVRVREKCSGAS